MEHLEHYWNTILKHVKFYCTFTIFCFICLGWIWSLLFQLFIRSHKTPLPWSALLLLIHSSHNSTKENTLLWISIFIPVGLAGFIVAEHFKKKHIKSIFGNAHWATSREIKKMGLYDCKNGLIIGEEHGRLLRAPLISHALIFAPSRSGKGVSQVIPIALTYPQSMLLVDIKDEIFEASSGYRQKCGHAVYSFAPARNNHKTHRWNPLDLISKNSPRLIADIDLICQTIISYSNDKDSMWVEEARTLLKGLILWLMRSGRPFNLGELVNFIKGTPDFIKELINIRDTAINEDGSININYTAFTNINNFIEKAPKEQSGVKSTLTAKLNLWDDPLIQAATETSDFDFREMRSKKMTIYLGIPVDQLDRLAPLMNLFIQLFLNSMTKQLPSKNEPYKVVLVLDEFCALGRLDVLKNGFGFLAGFNVHLMAIIQNIGQFYDIYGGRDKSDVFFQNTDFKIAYRQNAKTDREFVSDLCGIRAVKNYTKSYRDGGMGQTQTGSSEAYMSKPLITPNQIGNFSTSLGIAIFNGQPPIKYQRIIYYKDKRFKQMILDSINIPKAKLYFSQEKRIKKQAISKVIPEVSCSNIPHKALPQVINEIMHLVDMRINREVEIIETRDMNFVHEEKN